IPSVRRNSRSALPAPLKSATAMRTQSRPTVPTNWAATVCSPLIWYSKIVPSLSWRNRRSLLPSPLKSPSCDAMVQVGGAAGGSEQPRFCTARSTRMRGLVCVPPARLSVRGVPVFFSAASMASAETLGQAVRIAATAPATCGVAIEVPLKNAYVLVLCGTVAIEDRMLVPGATRSTTDDMLENDEIASLLVDDATVVAVEMHPGAPTAAVRLSLPAAMAVRTPAFLRLSIEGLRESPSHVPLTGALPRLILADASLVPPGRLPMLARM